MTKFLIRESRLFNGGMNRKSMNIHIHNSTGMSYEKVELVSYTTCTDFRYDDKGTVNARRIDNKFGLIKIKLVLQDDPQNRRR